MPVDPRRLLTALSRNRRTILVAGILGLVGGAVLAKTVVPREYSATASVIWEPAPPLLGDARPDPRELRTLVDSIKVPGNLAETRRRLGLPASIEVIGSQVDVSSSEKSNLISVEANWEDAETAPRIANTMVEVFLEQRLNVQRERGEKLFRTVEGDAGSARTSLAEARRAYDDFRKEHGIADLPVETQVAIESAAKLRAEADAARAEAAAEEARAEALRLAARTEPATTVISQTELRPDAIKLAETEAELAGARTRLSDDHPKILALSAESQGLRARSGQASPGVLSERVIGRNPQLDTIQQILAGSKAQREAALKRQSALAELAAAADQRIAKLSVVEGRASELLAAVRVAEAHLDELEKLRVRAADYAKSPVAGFRVVDPAVVPDRPSKSYRRLFAMMFPIATVLLAAGYVLVRAMRGLRVHTASEISFWGKGPVVASSCWPAEPRALRDLAVDLWAFASETHGTTLVLPMGLPEHELSEKVAACLNPPEFVADEAPGSSKPFAVVWEGEEHGPELRRAARLANRVLVVVTAGTHPATALADVHARVGRTSGVGYILLGVGHDLAKLPDRAGDVSRFWQRSSSDLRSPAASYEVSHG